MNLSDKLGMRRRDVLSVVGAGGKTTLIYRLAHELVGKILIATTTRMYLPLKGECDYLIINEDPCPACDGVYFLSGPPVGGKATAYAGLRRVLRKFDYTLIEADGANGKLLKGWAAYEPVVITDTTKTLGVLNLGLLGCSISPESIHRFDDFVRLTAADTDDEITMDHLKILVREMFRNAGGERILCVIGGAPARKQSAVSEGNETLSAEGIGHWTFEGADKCVIL